MQAAAQWLLILVLATSFFGLGPQSPALQANTLELTGPIACPSSGCAGGQHIGLRFVYDLFNTHYDANQNPNIKVCVYTTASWNGFQGTAAASGEVSGQDYTTLPMPANPQNFCPEDSSPPNGYSPVVESQAHLPANTPTDALRVAFRLGKDGAGTGRVMARLFAHSGGNWVLAATASSDILTMSSPAIANPAYVANDSSDCGVRSPCYINSDGDEAGGIGTGLKDAIDAADIGGTVFVLGSNTLKSNAVVVNKKMNITGMNDATITYTGPDGASSCSNPMLALDETATVRGLNIGDGNCSDPNRNLIEINSHSGRNGPDDVVSIESNDLITGKDAIFVASTTTDRVSIRFNQAASNFGHAVRFEKKGDSALDVTANNFYANREYPAVDCGEDATAPITNRIADHNYWGALAPSAQDTHCNIHPDKRLGTLIAHKVNGPGVSASRVRVTTEKTYASDFGKELAYNYTGNGAPFDMYIVDHGYMAPLGPPFSYLLGGDSPSPCSDAWDVFLADGVSPPNTLELYFKYYNKEGKTPGCLAVINSTQYCDQPTAQATPARFPLFWLYPPDANNKNVVTNWWDPTGARPEALTSGDGQTTTCHTDANEIQVSIDGTGRPNLGDLGYTPFMVGVPVLKSFTPLASNQTVTIKWETNNEPDINGFYILRGINPNQLTPINGDLINHQGSSSSGTSYTKTDTGRVNGQIYYYRLQVVRTDGYSFYSAIVPVTVNVATPTSPPPTRTFTPIRPTYTPIFTTVAPFYPSALPSRTPTPLKTRTPTPTSLVLSTLTPTIEGQEPGALETSNAISGTPTASGTDESGGGNPLLLDTGTPGAGSTLEPDQQTPGAVSFINPKNGQKVTSPVGVVSAASTSSRHPWLSLLLGLLAGLAVTGGAGGYWYYSARR